MKSLFSGPLSAELGIPQASRAGLQSRGTTGDLLLNMLDDQARLTRPLEAVVAACSTSGIHPGSDVERFTR